MIERGTGPKSLMEGSKGGQELGSSLTVSVTRVLRSPYLEEAHPLL